MTKPVTRAVILSAGPVTPAVRRYIRPGDCIVACDAAYCHAERLGVRPQSWSRLPPLGGRGGRLCMVLRRPAARSVNLRHPYSSCLICEG